MDTTLPSPKLPSLILSATLAIGLGSAFTGAAFAETTLTPTPAAQTVSYAGLDLADSGDARLLLRKIRVAAASVCGPEPAVSSLLPRAQHNWRECTTDAVDRAVADIGAPLVVALHTGQIRAQSPAGPTLASR